jgi:hypothetical protein
MLFRRTRDIPSIDDLPPRLIDRETGVVAFRLFPYYLRRLHGDWLGEVGEAEATPSGLPFPLLPGSTPIELSLRGGMTPAQVGSRDLFEPNSKLGKAAWWQWHAYAKTSVGWDPFPTPFFTSNRLTQLQFNPRVSDGLSGFEAVLQVLTSELGVPHERNEGTAKPPYRGWKFSWGTAYLHFEPRDWTLQVTIDWSTSG